MEAPSAILEFPVSSFQFRFSRFDFTGSKTGKHDTIFDFRVSILDPRPLQLHCPEVRAHEVGNSHQQEQDVCREE